MSPTGLTHTIHTKEFNRIYPTHVHGWSQECVLLLWADPIEYRGCKIKLGSRFVNITRDVRTSLSLELLQAMISGCIALFGTLVCVLCCVPGNIQGTGCDLPAPWPFKHHNCKTNLPQDQAVEFCRKKDQDDQTPESLKQKGFGILEKIPQRRY